MTAPRSTLDYLDDILDATDKIEAFTRDMSYEEFSEDETRPSMPLYEHWK